MTKSALAEAIEQCLAGNWARAHQIVMDEDEDQFACWIHAVVHRQEGDLSNASYWYSRCRRRLRKGVAPEQELREIRKALACR